MKHRRHFSSGSIILLIVLFVVFAYLSKTYAQKSADECNQRGGIYYDGLCQVIPQK